MGNRLRYPRFTVEGKVVGGFDPLEGRGKAVVPVSSTTYARRAIPTPDRPTRERREVDVPLIVWEPPLHPHPGMITGAVHKTNRAAHLALAHVAIADPSHPRAAGLLGRGGVMAPPRPPRRDRRRANASRLAVLKGDPHQVVLFAYERGADFPPRMGPGVPAGILPLRGNHAAARQGGVEAL